MRKTKVIFFVVMSAVFIYAATSWAIFNNGGFENGNFDGWTTGYGLNYGLSGSPPFSEGDIVIIPGGQQLLSVIGPNAVQDPRTNNLLQLPREGRYTAKVNDESDSYHLNYILQSDTITNADRDPSDQKLHVRFRFAAVLEDPGHPPDAQPFFHVYLKDLDTNTTLFDFFAYSGQPGVTWNVSNYGGSTWQWLDWQNVDIVVPDASLGHRLEIRALAADCAYGAHGGYVYLDGFGSAPPPPSRPEVVPTMTEWGMIIFVFLAGLGSVFYLRRQRRA